MDTGISKAEEAQVYARVIKAAEKAQMELEEIIRLQEVPHPRHENIMQVKATLLLKPLPGSRFSPLLFQGHSGDGTSLQLKAATERATGLEELLEKETGANCFVRLSTMETTGFEPPAVLVYMFFER